MAVLTEGHNYQDYLISNTWSADEGITAVSQEPIGGMQVEPTKPDWKDMVKALPWKKIGLFSMALLGLGLITSGLSNSDE
jgi:hypothetical protein